MHSVIRKIFNGAPFDPTEIRWCVFGKNAMTGKEEWLETVDHAMAKHVADVANNEGGNFEICLMTRGEIRRRFGEPECANWCDAKTGEHLFTSFERDGAFAIVDNPADLEGMI